MMCALTTTTRSTLHASMKNWRICGKNYVEKHQWRIPPTSPGTTLFQSERIPWASSWKYSLTMQSSATSTQIIVSEAPVFKTWMMPISWDATLSLSVVIAVNLQSNHTQRKCQTTRRELWVIPCMRKLSPRSQKVAWNSKRKKQPPLAETASTPAPESENTEPNFTVDFLDLLTNNEQEELSKIMEQVEKNPSENAVVPVNSPPPPCAKPSWSLLSTSCFCSNLQHAEQSAGDPPTASQTPPTYVVLPRLQSHYELQLLQCWSFLMYEIKSQFLFLFLFMCTQRVVNERFLCESHGSKVKGRAWRKPHPPKSKILQNFLQCFLTEPVVGNIVLFGCSETIWKKVMLTPTQRWAQRWAHFRKGAAVNITTGRFLQTG